MNKMSNQYENSQRVSYRVLRVGHGVERTEAHREFVNDEVVSIVLLLDESAETLLVLRATERVSACESLFSKAGLLDIVELLPRDTVSNKHVDGLPERQLESTLRAIAPLELVGRERLPDDGNFVLVFLGQSAEHVLEEVVEEFHDFVIVLLDSHLQIETNELGHVSVCVRVLRTEDRANLVYTLKVSSNRHLLGKLRRLCEESAT